MRNVTAVACAACVAAGCMSDSILADRETARARLEVDARRLRERASRLQAWHDRLETAVRAGETLGGATGLADDLRRCAIVREEIGPQRKLMLDANQRWDVDDAIASMRELARFDPWWIEEPTSPDDVLGHAAIARAVAPIGVATGEQCQNRVLFKQFMQAGAMSFCQIDACRLGGVNEVLAVLLMAAKFGIPVCPHAGGVGLCEYVQHLAIFDYLCVSASLEDRVVEYVDHLHEHFLDPVVIRGGRYVVPTAPGFSVAMKPESLSDYAFPTGAAWVDTDERQL